MNLVEVASFDVVHRQLSWPWIALDASGKRFAFASSDRRIETRLLEGGRLTEGAAFSLPEGVTLGGLHGFSIDAGGTLLAVVGVVDAASVVVTSDAEGERHRIAMDALAGAGFMARGHQVTVRASKLLHDLVERELAGKGCGRESTAEAKEQEAEPAIPGRQSGRLALVPGHVRDAAALRGPVVALRRSRPEAAAARVCLGAIAPSALDEPLADAP